MIKVINLSTLNRQAKFIIIINYLALKEHSRFFLFCLLHILTENSLQKQSMKQKQCDQHSQCFFNPLLLFHKSNTEIAILKRIFYKQILHWHLYFFFFTYFPLFQSSVIGQKTAMMSRPTNSCLFFLSLCCHLRSCYCNLRKYALIGWLGIEKKTKDCSSLPVPYVQLFTSAFRSG